MQACTQAACGAFYYSAQPYGMCTSPCGGGQQSRNVTCLDAATSSAVNAAQCTAVSAATAPASMRACNTGACLAQLASWKIDDPGSCTEECGGYRTQVVSCRCVCFCAYTVRMLCSYKDRGAS